MNFPNDLKYSKDHEWVRMEGNIAFVGVSDFAQGELGDIVYIDIPSLGKELKNGEIFGSVEAVKTVSDLFMPVDGKVLELNPELMAHPELVNADPYGKGWMVKIQVNGSLPPVGLLTSDEYKAEVGIA